MDIVVFGLAGDLTEAAEALEAGDDEKYLRSLRSAATQLKDLNPRQLRLLVLSLKAGHYYSRLPPMKDPLDEFIAQRDAEERRKEAL